MATNAAPSNRASFPPEVVLGALAETLHTRPSRRGPVRIGVLVVDGGPLAVTLESGRLTAGVDQDVDLSIVTNAVTLVDMVRGTFDPGAPGPDHLFLFGGDPSLFGQLAEGLATTQSWLALQANNARSKRKGGR